MSTTASSAAPDAGAVAEPRGAARSTDERASQHGKKAKILASVLAGLVVTGLLADGLWNSRKRPEKSSQVSDAAPKTVTQDPFVDFEARQKAEATKLAVEHQKTAATPSVETTELQERVEASSAEQKVREEARLEDLKHALAAVRSQEMVVQKPHNGSAPSKANASAEARPASEIGRAHV